MRIVTAHNSAYANIADWCWWSMLRYAQPHRIQCERLTIPDDFDRPASWFKLRAIQGQLALCEPNEIVLWVDIDTFFFHGPNIAHFIDADRVLNITKDDNGINCGVMAWRNCPESYAALTRMESEYPAFAEHPWFEQASLMGFVDTLDVNYAPKRILNAYPSDLSKDTIILHWPGMKPEERLLAMRPVARAMNFL